MSRRCDSGPPEGRVGAPTATPKPATTTDTDRQPRHVIAAGASHGSATGRREGEKTRGGV
jgi:hypothetical protein